MNGPDLGTVRALREALGPHADPERARQQQAYMKSALPFLGLTRAELRAAIKPILAERRLADRAVWAATVRLLIDEADHREDWYTALELTRHRHYREFQDPDTVPLYRDMILTTRWWDTVDEVAGRQVGDILARYRTEVTPAVAAWADADGLWLRRAALLSQLHHRADTDTDLLRRVLEDNLAGSRHGSTFWITKAVGWSLRQHARTDPEWTRAFVADHYDRLAPLSRREATRRPG